MEVNEVQSRFETLVQDVRSRIEKDPIRSFFVGVILGMFLVIFRQLLVPLAVILALVAAALYYFSNNRAAPVTRGPDADSAPKDPEMRQ